MGRIDGPAAFIGSEADAPRPPESRIHAGLALPKKLMKAPPRQNPYEIALAKGFEAVQLRRAENLAALGAQQTGPEQWELPVLDHVFRLDLAENTLERRGENRERKSIRVEWQILVLHYLAAPAPYEAKPAPDAEESLVSATPRNRMLSFAEIPDARGYDPVYRARVLERLCATAGRDRAGFVAASERIGGRPVEAGDAGFEFQIFPRLAVIVAWYAGDEELPPGVSFLYPENIAALLPVEDIVVLAERLVARLQGREP